MSKKSNTLLSVGLPLFFSVGLLAWIFSQMDLKHIYEIIRMADVWYLSLAAVVFFVINIVILMRWCLFMRALNLRFPLSSITKWFFIGLACNLLPVSQVGGDVVKTIGLAGKTKHKPTIVASVVLDRLSGFAGIVVVAAVMFFVGYDQIPDPWVGASIILMTLGALTIGAIFFSHRIYSFFCQALARWPGVQTKVMEVHYDIVLMKGKILEGVGGILLSCFAQMLLACDYYLVAKAFGQDVSFSYFMIFSPLVCVVSTIPSIGGLGVREMGWKHLLPKVGVSPEIAVSISLMNFVFMLGVGLLGGLIYVATLFDRRVQPDQAQLEPGRQKS
jgi:glycosyltransferase 2 family protein